MPQVLKDDVRVRIEAAALEVFAARGYARATMTAIAERAGVGTASTYRYHAGKRALFDAVVPREIARDFEALLDRRVHALARRMRAGRRGGADLGDELLRFWMAHRLAVVILLDRADGTSYAGFGARFVERLVDATMGAPGGGRPPRAARFVLARIFDSTRRTLAAILEAHADEDGLRQAIEAFWSYQIPGLEGFARWASAAGEESAPGPARASRRHPRRPRGADASRPRRRSRTGGARRSAGRSCRTGHRSLRRPSSWSG
jgi:AcrR family transcriptional regulator